MKKQTKSEKKSLIRLIRIERKCDRILSELIIARQRSQRLCEADDVIEAMHKAARKMRVQCERERDYIRSAFNIKTTGR